MQQMTRKHLSKNWEKVLLIKIQLMYKVKDSVSKGEIAHHDKFFVLLHCFQKLSATDASKRVC